MLTNAMNAANALLDPGPKYRAGPDMNKVSSRMLLCRIFWLFMILLVMAAPSERAEGGSGNFYVDIAPILTQRCVICHSGDGAPLGLRLDSYEAVLKGSARGPVVISGDPSGSEIIRRLKGVSQPRMPMTGSPYLSDSEIALFEKWVASGMPKGAVEARATPSPSTARRPAAGEPVTYLHVAPLFATRCARCHAEKGQMGPAPEGYRLTSYESTLSANDRVRVVPGNLDASELVRRIRGHARPRMPLDGPPYLTDEEILLIEEWVNEGAKNASGQVAPYPQGEKVRLHGTLGPDGSLDGLPLDVGPRTRIDKSPAPGDYVEVRGRLKASGTVEIERLRRR
jgi:mono/diheme cytochrome c family protein